MTFMRRNGLAMLAVMVLVGSTLGFFLGRASVDEDAAYERGRDAEAKAVRDFFKEVRRPVDPADLDEPPKAPPRSVAPWTRQRPQDFPPAPPSTRGFGAEAKSPDGPVKLNGSRLPDGVARLLRDDANDVTRFECVEFAVPPGEGMKPPRCEARVGQRTRTFIHRKDGWVEITRP